MIKLALFLLLAVSNIHTEPAHVVDAYETVVDCEISDGNVYSFFDNEQYYQIGDDLMLIMRNDEVVGVQQARSKGFTGVRFPGLYFG